MKYQKVGCCPFCPSSILHRLWIRATTRVALAKQTIQWRKHMKKITTLAVLAASVYGHRVK